MSTTVLIPLPVVAERLGGIHHQTVRNLIRCGELRATRVGTRVLVSEAELEDYIARNTDPAA